MGLRTAAKHWLGCSTGAKASGARGLGPHLRPRGGVLCAAIRIRFQLYGCSCCRPWLDATGSCIAPPAKDGKPPPSGAPDTLPRSGFWTAQAGIVEIRLFHGAADAKQLLSRLHNRAWHHELHANKLAPVIRPCRPAVRHRQHCSVRPDARVPLVVARGAIEPGKTFSSRLTPKGCHLLPRAVRIPRRFNSRAIAERGDDARFS